MPMTGTLPRRLLEVIWLGGLAFYILWGAASVPFHGDESTLLLMGRDFHYIFVEGDIERLYYDSSWRSRPNEQLLRLLNGTVSKLVYGWLGWLNGMVPGDFHQDWQWGRGYEQNVARGALPDAGLLHQARLASATQLALAAALFFQICKISINRPTACLASALFALHPNMLINGRRAMMEGSHILGLMLLLMAAVWLLKRRRWWRYCLLGIAAGIAVAAKHPNLIACALVLSACAAGPLYRLPRGGGQRAARDLAGMALAGALALAVFLLLNPIWWRQPLQAAPVTLAQRQNMLMNQVNIYGGYTSFSEQLSGFFRFVFKSESQYFEVADWAGYEEISAQIDAYEQPGRAGLLFIGRSARLSLLNLLLAALGALMLARDRRIAPDARWLLLLWSVGTALSTLWLTPLPWARYYLPLVPAQILLIAYALVTLAQQVWRRQNPSCDGSFILA